MIAILEDSGHLCWLGPSDRLELLAVRCLQVRSHIVGAISQVDLEVLVAKDLFVLTKYGIGVSRIEGRNVLKTGLGGGQKTDVNRIVGVRQPFEKYQSVLHS